MRTRIVQLAKGFLTTDCLAVLALVVSINLFFAPALFGRQTFFYRDLSAHFNAEQKFIRDSLRAGQIPLWNPYSSYGHPFAADPCNQIFYPATLLRLVLPFDFAFKFQVILHFYLAGAGLYFLLRRLGRSVFASLFGAALFTFGGPFVSLGNFLNYQATAACVPLALLATERAVASLAEKKSGWSLFLLLGAVFALQFLAGEPVTLMLTIAACFSFGLVRLSAGGLLVSKGTRYLAGFTAAGVFSFTLTAVQVLPFLELLKNTSRGQAGLPYDVAASWSLHPLSLVEPVAANFFGEVFGHSASAIPWLRALNENREPFILSLYLGAVPVILAVFAAIRGRRTERFFACLALASLFFALGSHNPVHRWLYDHVALLRSIRYPVKFFLFTALSTAVLAAYGIEHLRQWSRERKTDWAVYALRPGVFVVLLIPIMGVVSASLLHGATASALAALAARLRIADVSSAARELAPLLCWRLLVPAALLLPLVAVLFVCRESHRQSVLLFSLLFIAPVADLMLTHARTNPLAPSELFNRVPAIERVIDARDLNSRIFVDTGELDGNYDAVREKLDWIPVRDGWSQEALLADYQQDLLLTTSHRRIYTSVTPDWNGLFPFQAYEFRRFLRKLEPNARDLLLAATGVRYKLALTHCSNPRQRLVAEIPNMTQSPFSLYESNDWRPRAYVAGSVITASNGEEALSQTLAHASDATPVVVIGRKDAQERDAGARGEARIVADSGSRLIVEATLESDGFLVLSDSYEPNWRAETDGKSLPVLQANHMFRAVRLSRGPHMVEFTFCPRGYFAGALISLSTVIIAVAFSLALAVSRVSQRRTKTRLQIEPLTTAE